MFYKLKNSKEVRLTLAIAAGVFGGFVAIALCRQALDRLQLEWNDPGSYDPVLIWSIVAMALGAGITALYVLSKKIRRTRKERRLQQTPAPLPAHLRQGVAGWLLFLCVVLVVLTPIANLVQIASGNLPSAYRFVALAVSGFSVYVGIGLWRVLPGAVSRARIFLWALLICIPIVSISMAAFGQIAPDAAVIDSARAVIFSSVWTWYLNQSKRVRATFQGI